MNRAKGIGIILILNKKSFEKSIFLEIAQVATEKLNGFKKSSLVNFLSFLFIFLRDIEKILKVKMVLWCLTMSKTHPVFLFIEKSITEIQRKYVQEIFEYKNNW